jgi:hypothetical protein
VGRLGAHRIGYSHHGQVHEEVVQLDQGRGRQSPLDARRVLVHVEATGAAMTAELVDHPLSLGV